MLLCDEEVNKDWQWEALPVHRGNALLVTKHSVGGICCETDGAIISHQTLKGTARDEEERFTSYVCTYRCLLSKCRHFANANGVLLTLEVKFDSHLKSGWH